MPPTIGCSAVHDNVAATLDNAKLAKLAGCGLQAGTQQAQVAAAHAQAVAAVARTTRELRAEKERAEALASQLDSLRTQSATATAAAAEAASAAATELARLEVRGCIALNSQPASTCASRMSVALIPG